ncbi:L-ascorbate oxidase homolog [Cryptomeria japonica]|uniref:L-ascorbate oxidase homolog n=1 Tax=Cryptomeria japonica TaxID=3369 RepID=UPI0025AD2193|nr:L-ascorbate oxidase homolog [Cryptomeria japonica]
MGSVWCPIVHVYLIIALFSSSALAEDPYKFFTWKVTYGTIWPLGVPQQGILINGQFPGPQIDSVTNDNIIINVYNNLNEPFLLSWNGVQQRRNSWQDGVFGTNCPIPPGTNFTYKFQMKDQIGSFFYFPSMYFHKAAGGFGGIKIVSRPRIPVPFPEPDGDITLLIGDWYKASHTALRTMLDNGKSLGNPDGVLINGRGSNGYSFTVEQGKTYRLRISNVGLSSSLNFRIQGHKMKLVEVEGSHTVQNFYDSLDIHVGQSYSVLITANQPPQDYHMVASTRFTSPILTGLGILDYSNSRKGVSGPIPSGPTTQIDWSVNQAKSIRRNLTSNGPRPNPQGSYHYGNIAIAQTFKLANSAPLISGKQRYAVNGISFINPDTPLKLADYFHIGGLFTLGGIPNNPDGRSPYLQTAAISAEHRAFIEIVFQNNENTIQSWHLDGFNFFVAGMEGGEWTLASRKSYNVFDAVSRCTTQVYPKSWTAVLLSLDNPGMWNLRSQTWERQYLGQQTYLRIVTLGDEYDIPQNALLCGKAAGRPHTSP